MILAANLLSAAAVLIDYILMAYLWIVVASAIISWVNADPWNPIVKFIRNATSPLYRKILRWFPFLQAGGMDWSPVVIIAIIFFIRQFVVVSMIDYSILIKSKYVLM